MTNAPWALVLDGALGEVLVARASLRPGEDIEVSLGERTDRMLGVLPSLERLFPTRDDRAAIVVVILGIGPGSYTGVRSAASAAAVSRTSKPTAGAPGSGTFLTYGVRGRPPYS